MASSEASINPSALIIAESTPIPDSNSNLVPKQKKPNRGRIKIPIQKIQDKNKKHVTFSKRRKGLFKKATELCVLCDASVAIVTFSEAGKVFAFGHPSTDAVIHRYLSGGDGPGSSQVVNQIDDLWWNRPIEELGFEELGAYAESLNQTLFNLQRRIAQLDCESSSQMDSKAAVKFDHALSMNQGVMVPAMGNQMNYCYNNEYDMMSGVDPTISLMTPGFLSMATQYDQSDISSVVAMPNFNSMESLERFRV